MAEGKGRVKARQSNVVPSLVGHRTIDGRVAWECRESPFYVVAGGVASDLEVGGGTQGGAERDGD